MSKQILDLPYSFEESIARLHALYDDVQNAAIFKIELLVKESNFTIRGKFNDIWYYIYDNNNLIYIDYDCDCDAAMDELVDSIKLKLANVTPKPFIIYYNDSFFALDDDEEKIVLYKWDANCATNPYAASTVDLYTCEEQPDSLVISTDKCLDKFNEQPKDLCNCACELRDKFNEQPRDLCSCACELTGKFNEQPRDLCNCACELRDKFNEQFAIDCSPQLIAAQSAPRLPDRNIELMPIVYSLSDFNYELEDAEPPVFLLILDKIKKCFGKFYVMLRTFAYCQH